VAGDEALRVIASLMCEQVRRTDIAGRLGGDEFGILLPETDMDAAGEVLERVRSSVAKLAAQKRWRTSTSIGAVTVPGTSCDATAEEVIRRADGAMYVVKAAGKDSVQIEPFA